MTVTAGRSSPAQPGPAATAGPEGRPSRMARGGVLGGRPPRANTERPRLVLPGLIPADPQLERYRVHPGGLTAVELDAGDEITVIDTEGRQRGELTVLAGRGEDYAALGAAPDTAATVVRSMSSNSGSVTDGAGAGPQARLLTPSDTVAALAARGLDPAAARAVRLFGEWSP